MRSTGCASFLILAACVSAPPAGIRPPTGATIERDGYATIVRAPPARYQPPPKVVECWQQPLPAGQTRLPTDDFEILDYRCQRHIRIEQARAEIMQLRADAGEAQTLAARLRLKEPDNFVELEIRRSPVAAWKFSFKHDPNATLRRYSSNPRFIAARLPYTTAEADALRKAWWSKLEPYVALAGAGAEGVTFGMTITEAEFRSIPRFRNLQPPPGVRIDFPREPELPRITADAAPFVRIFPQQLYFPGIILTGAQEFRGDARITLRDGCLFFGDRLLRVNRTMGLFRDSQGYLSLRNRLNPSEPILRIGEQVTGGGGYSERIDEATRATITSQCGNHAIVDLYEPRSRVNWEKYLRSQYPSANR